MVRKELGMVTAYAYAVSKGYTGTEEEFAELMASYATVAESAEASAQAADGSASAAAGSATNASGSASAATGSASAAAQSASTASTKAENAASSATAAAQSASTASTKAGEATSSASAAAQSATQAAGSASAAAQSATDANTAKTDAQTAKTAAETAQEKAEEAQAAAEAAAQTLVIDDTLTQENQAAEAKTVGDALETKAEVDGYYQDMAVGDAEQLISSKYVEDNVPYKFRTSGGSADVGNREYVDKIVGGTIAWNQVYAKHSSISETVAGITATIDSDGFLNVSGTATANGSFFLAVAPIIPANHVYLLLCDGFNSQVYWGRLGFARKTEPYYINKHTVQFSGSASIAFMEGTTYNFKVRFSGYDLTQMFGSTVADAVYVMEQSTAGAGVAWFRSMFPNDYYDYNAGELISVSGLQSHDTVGFNQWDEEWENGDYKFSDGSYYSNARICSKRDKYIKVLSGATYYVKTAGYALDFVFYDENKSYIGTHLTVRDGTLTPPDGASYARFSINPSYGTTYKHDICISLAHNNSRNGEYEPYVKHSYPLDSSLTLRGVPKLSADNRLCFDGDEYLPSGKVNRRFGIVDLGTLNWIYRNNESPDTFSSTPFSGYNFVSNVSAICSKYVYNGTIAGIVAMNNAPDKFFALYHNSGSTGTGLYIKDSSYTDANAFKASLSGVYLIYELATPTEETAEPYSEIQLVNDWGTEEYVSGTICPVGHETRYPANLRDKLQHLPDLASADGYYVVQQTGSQMSLVHFRIPQAPADDGTYTLKATVSGGVPTYTWEVMT